MIGIIYISNSKILLINIKKDPHHLVEGIHTPRDKKIILFRWYNGDSATSIMIMISSIKRAYRLNKGASTFHI